MAASRELPRSSVFQVDNYQIHEKKGASLALEARLNKSLQRLRAIPSPSTSSTRVTRDDTSTTRVGALCGHLQAALGLAKSWEDELWAQYRVMVDVRVERFIQQHKTAPDQWRAEMPEEYWRQATDPERVFAELQSSANASVRAQSEYMLNVIQKYLILGDVSGLVEYMYDTVRASGVDNQSLRFMAHLVLFYRALGVLVKEELCVYVVEAYVQALIRGRHVPLVACYTAALPPTQQTLTYASFLQQVTESGEREVCLRLATDHQLDVPGITRMVVENTRRQPYSPASTDTSLTSADVDAFHSNLERGLVSAGEWEKINSIDWLVFDPAQRVEAVREVNNLVRIFIINNRLTAAKSVLQKLPGSSRALVLQQWRQAVGNDALPGEYEDALTELDCHATYLTGLDLFSDWYRYLHQQRPREPPRHDVFSKYTEQVQHEHLLQQYEADVRRWAGQRDGLADACLHHLYLLLRWEGGAWTCPQEIEVEVEQGVVELGEEAVERRAELARVRQLCVPRVCQLVYEVLTASDRPGECLQLVNMIGERRLFKSFRKPMLRQFIKKLNTLASMNLQQGANVFGLAGGATTMDESE